MKAANLAHILGSWASGEGPLHHRLAVAIQQAIRNGAVLPSSRLPSERHLAESLALSRTTVVTAYENLRAGGWIESRPGSGTWVSARSTTVQRARLHAYTERLAESPLLNMLMTDNDEILDFSLGSPFALENLPPELTQVSAEEQAVLQTERNYMPLGLPRLRQAVAQYYSQAGLPTTAEQILIANGAQQAISLVAGLYVQRGDTVLVEDPTYFGALDVFRLAGARLAKVPIGPRHVEPDILRDRILAVSPRLVYLTPTYQNPTGVVMPEAARLQTAQLAREFGIAVIEDVTLADLTLEGIRPMPIPAQGNCGNVLMIGSLSKLFWPGLRVGWVRAAPHVISQLARVKCAFDLGCAMLTQTIAVRLMSFAEQARAMRALQLKPRRDLLVRLLHQHLPEWQFSVPHGGLFLWVRLPGTDTSQFAQIAARHGIAVAPGATLSADGSETESIRIPFLHDEATIELAVQRLIGAWAQVHTVERVSDSRIPVIV
jgi:DNA-binding transcriptional MocR family regulator